MSFCPSKEDFETLFKILNFHLFNNSLPELKILYCSPQKIVETINYHLEKSNIFDRHYETVNCFGAYSAICLDIENKYGKIIGLRIFDDTIMINENTVKKCIFIFAVATLCHEMIHYAERFELGFE
nr:MAG TPA: SprT-like domain-containing protein Spartan/DNA Complex repair, protease, DNA BINDING [Caudoviricetes sp.]